MNLVNNEFIANSQAAKDTMIQPEQQSQPLVSVIIPTHNRAHFLREMLASIAAQTYRPIEVLVIDDGSTDDTPQMILATTQKLFEAGVDCRYVVQTKSNAGCARNRGFRLSAGEYIIFMDSDDYARPEMITRMVESLQRTDADFCVCDVGRFRHCPEDLDQVKRFSDRQHTAYAHIRAIALQVCFLAKRYVIDAIGPWDEQLSHRDDVEYTFRILVGGFRGTWLREVLYYWRMHSTQMSHRDDPEALASSLLVLTKMVQHAKFHGQHTWRMRAAFGQEFARLAYVCNLRGYYSLSKEAKRVAEEECPGIGIPLVIYEGTRRILGHNGIALIKSLHQWISQKI